MAKPKLSASKPIQEVDVFGSVELLKSAAYDAFVYVGKIQIPRALPETRIRIRDAFQHSDKSPDYTIDCVAINDQGQPEWEHGAGSGWYREKDGKPRIELALNIGVGGRQVNAALFPADKSHQPKPDDRPEGYKPAMGPCLWRLAYTPPRTRSNTSASQVSDKAAAVVDEIPY